jgi:ubiquinone/menaquinone biosynthesis C-methylase UbiE
LDLRWVDNFKKKRKTVAHDKTVQQVFEAWGRDYHADGMEAEHWPRVATMFDLIPQSNGRYLEIGIGNGYGLAHMATNQFAEGRCMGMDLSESMVELARRRTTALPNVTVEAGDFLERDFADVRFNTIFSMEVFYYFSDINRGIDKAFSMLKAGGTLWVAVNYYAEHSDSEDWPDRVGTPMQRWSQAEYVAGFKRAGFTDIKQKLIDTPIPDNEHGHEPTLLTSGVRP